MPIDNESDEDIEVSNSYFKLDYDNFCNINKEEISPVDFDFLKSEFQNNTIFQYNNTIDTLLPELQISTHPVSYEICSKVDHNLLLSDLTPEIIRLIEQRLNPTDYPNNWETLSVKLGASIDEINNLRQLPSPVGNIIKMFGTFSLDKFLKIICEMNRIDLLILLKKSLNTLKTNEQKISQFSTDETALMTNDLCLSISKHKNQQKNINELRMCSNKSNIFVLHHEISKELRAMFKFLIHNLQRCAPPTIKIIDVDDCFDELNLYDTGEFFFNHAKEVLVVFSSDYINSILMYNKADLTTNINFLNSRIQLKFYLHNLTNSEYIQNGMRNQRFRVAIMKGTNRSQMPNGWPTNTIQYLFPDNFSELCQRLFSESYNNITI